MKRHFLIFTLLFLTGMFILLSCGKKSNPAGQSTYDLGILTITCQVNSMNMPLAVWIKNTATGAMKTLYTSLWLADSGIDIDYVCPTWSALTTDARESIDSVTGATLQSDSTYSHSINVAAEGLAAGTYSYHVECYYGTDDYNLLYSGNIELGASPKNSVATATYNPESTPAPADPVVSDVEATYQPE